jgi:hypothetical protein
MKQSEEAEWITRYEKGEITSMNWAPVRPTETTVLFSEVHNWRSPGSDQITN